ncbi:methylated-DNA--[protein]-cysteine S-methyltransferase [Microbacterium oxydans]|uniref:methylated-DNA--[protein]-cysteine S-methyltransferase n=1 Tax=Microbacterium oxydans TaxID=82380 RepID=UPI0024ACBD20|nr:methylated-DNA--[protein]-cysteine S-methyltransferase [Microbacterium oxydans]
MSAFGTLATPVGVVGVVSDGVTITRVTWRATPLEGSVVVSEPGDDPLLAEALAQLRAYFDGRLQHFDVPVDLGVQTAATRAVLVALHEIVAHGETITYGGLAARSGTAVPARGIGAIMGANPVPLIVPCHRVVAGDGLGGCSGGEVGRGLETKRWLLEHEGALPTSLF